LWNVNKKSRDSCLSHSGEAVVCPIPLAGDFLDELLGEETLSILSDPVLMAQIHESEQALLGGEQTTTLAELRAGLQNRRDAAA
jgi:hypothetical protein